jgi:hypothetical protein
MHLLYFVAVRIMIAEIIFDNFLIEARIFKDGRGFFLESYNQA